MQFSFRATISVIEKVLKRKHTLSGKLLTVEEKMERSEEQTADASSENLDKDTPVLEVSGFKPGTSEDTLSMYFESARRSGGGEVVEVRINEAQTKATVKFANKSGNINFTLLVIFCLWGGYF